MFRSPAARIRCVAGSSCPIKAEISDRIRCVDSSLVPTPWTVRGRVGTEPARIHGHGYECVLRLIIWRDPGDSHRTDTACPDIHRSIPAVRRHLPESFNLDPVGQLHDNRPSVIKMPVPENFIVMGCEVEQIPGWAPGLLLECHIGFLMLCHFVQFPPWIISFGNVPTHDADCGHRFIPWS